VTSDVLHARVKICGLTRRDDVLMADEAGADLLGVVMVASSPRACSPSQARSLLAGVRAKSVMVVADLERDEVVPWAETVEASVIQLHGSESPEYASWVRDEGPWDVWKALPVRGIEEVRTGMKRFRGAVDGLVLDGWHPSLLGGTGKAFPWDQVAGLRSVFPDGMTFVAAGGLRPDNVAEAIGQLRPHVVDVSSGVEVAPGIKDVGLVESFVRNARKASRGSGS
jgi:phosphoribosylanthranilate isomerase